MHINRRVECFLRQYNMPPTKFGRLAARDPRLVLDMRMGREVRPETVLRLDAFIENYTGGPVNVEMAHAKTAEGKMA